MKPFFLPTTVPSLEPLEARIAPAVMHIGATGPLDNNTDTEYHEDTSLGVRPDAFAKLNFVDTATAGDAISNAVNPLHKTKAFFVQLGAGDSIERFTIESNYQELILVRSGNAVAYFTDLNGDNEYNDGEFTGLSLGPNAVVEINGGINGDVVTNLDTKGTKTTTDDTVEMSSLIGPKQGIQSLGVLGGGLQPTVAGGGVQGKILSGGDINSLFTAGNVSSVLAGSAANLASFDFFAVAGAGEGIISFSPTPGTKGSNIRNVQVVSLSDRLEAGAGGAGVAGGSLTNIQITGDSDGFSLLAGAGGSTDATHPNGGAGGAVTKVLIAGLSDNTLNNTILVKAGAGGNGASTGAGGAGGAVRDVRVGFQNSGGVPLPSDNLLADNVRIEGGLGGSGKTGGAGGRVSLVNILTKTPSASPDPMNVITEVAVLGGNGGAAVAALGKAGAGGAADTIVVRDQADTFDTDILVQGGSAGAVTLAGSAALGAAGGAVTNATLLGSALQVRGGDGSTGKTGGVGGAIRNVTVPSDDAILAKSISFYAGHGGDGTAGNAGAGGDLSKLQVFNSDLAAMTVNPGTGGNGGNSVGGKGGKGGSATNLFVTDIDDGLGRNGSFTLRAGTGGDGDKGGGAGGVVTTLTLEGLDLNAFITGGAGGNALMLGRGGVGGTLTGVEVVTAGSVTSLAGVANVAGSLTAGAGGNGAGLNQAGGKGGDVRSAQLNLNNPAANAAILLNGDGTITAGNGGGGAVGTGAAGAGGSVITSAVFDVYGNASLIAGDAGVVGGKPGAGGSITGNANAIVGLRGNLNLTAMAGDGSFGGAGGNINTLTYGNAIVANPILPTPAGSIRIEAGAGSQGSTIAGAGGSISGVNGSASSGINQSTIFLAGDGGGDVRTGVAPNFTYTGSHKSAAGGSIKNVTVSQGGATGGLITFEAGDAGHSNAATKGAAGGSISGVGISGIAQQAILRSFAAGDGGDGAKQGGTGGSISDVQVLGHDIGVRTGEYYGYTMMGGIFAGLGGAGVAAGTAGSVTNISADTIAAIVAGKGNIPGLADKISNITLNSSNQLLFRNNSLEPNSPFQLTFNGQTTNLIPGNATAAQLATALNSLSEVQNAGGISVLTYTADGGYVVQFGSAQVATTDSTPNAAEIKVALESMPTVAVKGGVTTSDQPDGIHVQFNGGGPDAVIPQGATVAQIAQALNATGLNAFGAFGVTQDLNTLNYRIVYNTFGFGDQQQITGAESVPVKVLEKLQGMIGALTTAESSAGEFTMPTTVTVPGSTPLTIQEIVGGDIGFTTNELVTGDNTAAPPVAEVQEFTLTPLDAYSNSVFTLNFQSVNTAQIASNQSDAALAAQIDSALEGLTTIQSLTGPAGNKVVVSVAGTRTFDIQFTDTDGDVEAITGHYIRTETQRLDLGTLPTIPGSTFHLTFVADTTNDIPSTTNAAQIDAELEALPAIQALNGPAGDEVTVTAVGGSSTVFDITFNSNGDAPGLTGATKVPAFESLDLSRVLAIPGGKFRLNFDEPTTFDNETTPLITPGVDDTATASIIQTNLNALDSVQAVGGVLVNSIGAGKFNVSFGAAGAQNAIIATGFVSEVQNLDLNSINAIPFSQFTLSVKTKVPVDETRQYTVVESYGVDSIFREGQLSTGEFPVTHTDGTATAAEKLVVDRSFLTTNFALTGRLQFSFSGDTVTTAANAPQTGAGSIDAAIESLPGIAALSTTFGPTGNKVTVTPANPAANTFTVTFNGNGDVVPDLTITGIVPEVEVFDLNNAEPASQTVFHYTTGAGTTDSIVLANDPTANIALLDSALDAIVPGGVTVTNQGGGFVRVSFNTPGDIPNTALTVSHEVLEHQTIDLTRIVGTGATFTLTVNGTTTTSFSDTSPTLAADITAAIDPLIDDGSALNGTNDVTVTRNGNFVEIAFTTLRGNQPELIALATLGTGTTTRLSSTATAAQIDAALDPVTIGGVSVTEPGLVGGVTPTAGTYDITFGDLGNQPAIVATTYIHEIQSVDVYDTGLFTLSFFNPNTLANDTTGPLSPPVAPQDPVNPTPAEIADLNVKAQAVEDALNNLPAIILAGGVDVVPTTHQALYNGVLTTVYDNTSFDVSFRGDGDQPLFTGIQTEIMPNTTKTEGSPTSAERQIIHYFPKNAFEATHYAQANLVGAIVDIDEHNANVFHFVNLDGSVDGLNRPTFTLGDRPLDGIVMSRIFDQATVNFTPEARLTGTVFFDNDNLL